MHQEPDQDEGLGEHCLVFVDVVVTVVAVVVTVVVAAVVVAAIVVAAIVVAVVVFVAGIVFFDCLHHNYHVFSK